MANEYLKRTPTSSGNRKVFTWSGWVKKQQFAYEMLSFSGPNTVTTGLVMFGWGTTTGLYLNFYSGSTSRVYEVDEEYRDFGSWLHYQISIDTSQTTEDDRINFYINGVQRSLSVHVDYSAIPQNYLLDNMTAGKQTLLGTGRNGSGNLSGYSKLELSDIFFVDGQALTPDVFGFYKDGDGYISVGSTQATDFKPGQWMPHSPTKIKKDVNRRGGFGVNGYYLPMNDSSNPGADFHTTPNTIITLKGEDLPQPRNGAPTTSDAYVSQLRPEKEGTLGFDGVVKFDGSGDYLEIPDSDDFDFGSGDFTVEAFVEGARGGSRVASVVLNQSIGGAASNSAFYFGAGTDGTSLYLSTSGSSWTNFVECSTSSTLHNNGFHHVAWQRRSNTLEIYVDGILQPVTGGNASFTGTINNSSRVVEVGRQSTSGSNFNGFISNLRVVKGTAVYTGNFTAPTEPLTNVTNTKLLCCNSSTSATAATVAPGTITANGDAFATKNELTGSIVLAVPGIAGGQGSGYGDYSADIRGSGTNKTLTASGNAAVASVASYYGSALSFDGTGDFLSIPNNSDFNYSDGGDFTIELWLYRKNTGGNDAIIGVFENSVARRAWQIEQRANEALRFQWWADGSSAGGTLDTSTSAVPTDQWTHICAERNGDLVTLYINGVASAVDTSAGSFYNNTTDPLRIGVLNAAGDSDLNANIQDVRIYKGVAKYKSGFDVPKPYTPVGIEAFRTNADTCKNNFATWNAIDRGSLTLSDGNLSIENSGNYRATRATIGIPTTGKWYYEHRESTVRKSNVIGSVGIAMNNHTLDGNAFGTSFSGFYWGSAGLQIAINGTNAGTNWISSPGIGDGDILNIAYDADSRNIWFGINGTYYTVSGVTLNGNGNPTSGTNPSGTVSATYSNLGIFPYCNAYNTISQTNFGQNPTFGNSSAVNKNRINNGTGDNVWNQSSNTGTHTDWTVASGGTELDVAVPSGHYSRVSLRSADGTIDPKKTYLLSFKYTTGPANLGVQNDQGYMTAVDGSVSPNGLSSGNLYSFVVHGSSVISITGFNASTYSLDNVIVSEIDECYTDTSGKGKFHYQPPTGFLALCEDNLPTPAIADPGKHFKSVLYRGDTNAGHKINVGFKPDLVWIKNRTTEAPHGLYDIIRGPEYDLRSDSTAASTQYAGFGVVSFDEDGFTVQGNGTVSNSADNFVAWCWKAGGAAVSNNDGSITSQVSANQTAGFSIVSYTGTATAGTIGHGLGKRPKVVIVKRLDVLTHWTTWFDGISTNTDKVMSLDLTTAEAAFAAAFNSSDTTTTTFPVGTGGGQTNASSSGHIAYCWAEIEGYSKFGSYVGNGNNTDGPFVYCGFKPAWVIVKCTSVANGNWIIYDSSRCSTNINGLRLGANQDDLENQDNTYLGSDNSFGFDLLSNGFKVRTGGVNQNNNNETYIFMAFAESPFQTANAK